MKKLSSITFSALLCFTAFAQIDIKEINKSLVKIEDGLYASKYEVSNKLYMTFLSSLKNSNDTGLLTIAQIDTLRWRDKYSYNEPYIQHYHKHPAYQNYPVVCINYEAAKLFCEWLTAQYNADPKRKFKKVLFQLPSESEWIMAAQAGDNSATYPWQGNDLHNKTGEAMCNFKQELNDTIKFKGKPPIGADITAPVGSYYKNNFGLYNMSGNVAEMINEKGIVKGGSWRDKSEYLAIATKYKYDGNAQAFVGFRYFAQVLEN